MNKTKIEYPRRDRELLDGRLQQMALYYRRSPIRSMN